MRPTLRQLQYLVAVADTGRFGLAAKRLAVSQPSLSAQIAEAEAHLGAPLIERARAGAFLTPVGEEVVRRARAILVDVADLKSVARRGADVLSGRIRLGVLPTIGPYLLPAAVRRLHGLHPDLRLAIREERTIDLAARLDDGRMDAVISSPADHPGADHATLFTETFWICAAPDDPLAAGRGALRSSDLAGRTLLTLGYGHRLSQLTQALADAAGAHVSAEYEGTSLDALRQMAATGAGLAVLPSIYAVTEARRDPDLSIRPLDHAPAQREIALIWRPGSPVGAAAGELATVLRDVGAGLLEAGDGAAGDILD